MLSRWTNATVCAVAMVAAVLPIGAASTAQAAPGPCPDLHVVAIPGTWETSKNEPGKGMLAAVADGLPGDVRTDYVAYPATAFPWEGEVYGRSKREATDIARALIRDVGAQCPETRFALLGYSQGADAAGDLAAQIGTGLGVVAPNRVGLVGLIADPRRSPTDQLIGPPVPGAGAGGPRVGGFGWLTPVTYTFCAPGDLYCATPEGDFAARIAGILAQASDPSQFDQLPAGDLVGDVLAAGGLGLLHDQLNNSAYEERRRQIDNFLESGAHQSYPSYPVAGGDTSLTWLRRHLVALANG
ncbi:cutinase family protein [Nocardia farcinica]|uniref:Cutinase n=2 Tax=Nocardia farcinica TaxID=37329 RepID=Q5Z0L3_NOCFA|nr:cutinase family protein [Nocardia farcinica]PEH79339.1 cutinase family protein [Nocardia sp. FDAARGOS_372]AXK86090.1 cutinase family protein [Nocardia farcinica]MBA4855043.1 cutinase family protein [Nocardia farcinica]MBC9815959.1 cutinase family protein [Nocardia farcinica]MBF6068467.1 cutinase family protein [Nocardia farcinica]